MLSKAKPVIRNPAMHRLLVLPIFFMLSIPLWAQDADQPDTEAEQSAATETGEADDDAGEDANEDSVEDLDVLDELYPEEEEDKFIPSEDVAFGQSLVFPTDI
jgi:hypothetical protein